MTAALKLSSTPTITEFDPRVIPFQMRVLNDIDHKYNYDLGVQEVLLSGSVGSAKTILMAHAASTHALKYPGSVIGLGRLTLPSLKKTLIQTIIDHLSSDLKIDPNVSSGDIHLPNGSKMLAFSWSDKKYKKFRSNEFSMFVIEELTENAEKEFYDEIKMRIRLPHVRQKILLSGTNPDGPTHWAHKYFMREPAPNKHVYYSLTEQNPFLDKSYIDGLRQTLDPKMARRMLYGEWIDIRSDVIYYNYDRDRNFKDEDYKINPSHPIHICFDFNIGVGKPFSLCLFQYINGVFHIFDEVIIQGTSTEQAMLEIESRGIFETKTNFRIHGDATGKARSTKSLHSDYDIIEKYLSKVRRKDGQPIKYKIDVPNSNPPVRTRHNNMNAMFLNSEGQIRLYVYKKAKTVDEGLTLTKLKDGADYIEDDSPRCPYQHVTTAAGYGVVYMLIEGTKGQSVSMVPR